MCVVSDKIKFCSCVEEGVDITKLDNYWILYRLNPKSATEEVNFNEIEIGKLVKPEAESTFQINENIIAKRLNESEAFDIQIKFKNKDTLVIYLTNNLLERFSYQFEFERKKWNPVPLSNFNFTPFEVISADLKSQSFLTQKLEKINGGKFDELWNNK
jgi:hypothetical protein